MPTFFEKLDQRAKEINSILCVGLDPKAEVLQEQTGEQVQENCLQLIEATKEFALAFKLNVAYFEVLGVKGWEALRSVIQAVPDEIPVILDAKRGDLSSTASAYARSAFDMLGADAITLNPYLGYDSLTPFMHYPDKGLFLLCKTSNPGSVDLQDLPLGGHYRLMMVYEKIAGLATEWGTNDNLGLVVDATFPDALRRVRQAAPGQWFLAPGLDGQGADLKTALQAGLREDGLGLLIDISQCTSRTTDFQKDARNLVSRIREAQENTKPRKTARKIETSQLVTPLVEGLLSMGCIRFGEFTLKPGSVSPIFIDLRRLVSFPGWMTQVAAAFIRLLRNLEFDRLAGVPYAALPLVTAVSLQGNWPMIYSRKTSQEYGAAADIEGIYYHGETVVLIDDLAITGDSLLKGIEKLTAAGLQVHDVVVLIEWDNRAKEALAQRGFKLHALFTLTRLLDYWEETERLPGEQIAEARKFVCETNFQ